MPLDDNVTIPYSSDETSARNATVKEIDNIQADLGVSPRFSAEGEECEKSAIEEIYGPDEALSKEDDDADLKEEPGRITISEQHAIMLDKDVPLIVDTGSSRSPDDDSGSLHSNVPLVIDTTSSHNPNDNVLIVVDTDSSDSHENDSSHSSDNKHVIVDTDSNPSTVKQEKNTPQKRRLIDSNEPESSPPKKKRRVDKMPEEEEEVPERKPYLVLRILAKNSQVLRNSWRQLRVEKNVQSHHRISCAW